MFGLGMSTYGNLTNASMAYLPFMPFNPFGITNFGGDIQIFPVENYQTSQIGLAFNQVAQASGWPAGIFGGYSMTPQINMNAVVAQASAMAAQSLNQLASQEINTALQTIAGQKINDLKTSDMDPQSAYLKANELKVAVNNLIAGKPENEEKADKTNEKDNEKSEKSPEASSDTKKQGSKADPKNFTSWVDAFHDATFKIGTDNEVFDACCEEITKDDVIERMIQWNQSYPGESFMEVFMADADKDQKLRYGRQIQRALRDKAQELGIDLSNNPDYQAITKELNSLLWIDNGVADNFNAVIQKLAAKMGYKYEYKEYSMT